MMEETVLVQALTGAMFAIFGMSLLVANTAKKCSHQNPIGPLCTFIWVFAASFTMGWNWGGILS